MAPIDKQHSTRLVLAVLGKKASPIGGDCPDLSQALDCQHADL